MFWLIVVDGEPFEMYDDYDHAFEAFDNYCDSYPYAKVALLECNECIVYGGVEVL